MDFDEFEQLVLKVLLETDVPVTAAHVAYLGRVSVRTAERHLARMVEHGTLLVRTSMAGVVEYIYAGRAGAGVAWMATTLMGYACCFLPGLFLHGLCLVSAAQTRQS